VDLDAHDVGVAPRDALAVAALRTA
jgi:hypothetical protein